MNYNPNKIIFNSQSAYDKFCEGYNGQGNNYLLALNLATACVKKKFFHEGSVILDHINSFDSAEVANAFIGQINMITVSSFCGPMGAILGYDFLKLTNHFSKKYSLMYNNETIEICDANDLIQITKELFGTVNTKRFPIIPGSHTFCASKNIKVEGPAHIYAAIGLGIAVNRLSDANLMMEDIGQIPLAVQNIEEYKEKILNKLAKSIFEIGNNQKVQYSRIFVGLQDSYVSEDEIGCALVACPYFKIAKQALSGYNPENFHNVMLDEWLKKS